MIILLWGVALAFTRFFERTWWGASSLLALVMFVSAVGTAVFAPEYYMSVGANIYLWLVVMAALFGSLVGHATGTRSATVDTSHFVKPGFLLVFGMIFALLSFIFTLSAIGARLGDLLSPNSIINLAQAATYRRYTEGLDFPIYYNISNAFFISYCMILAKLLAYRVGASTLHVIPIAIYISTNMLITTRAPILFALIISIFTFIYCYRERYGYFPHLLSRRSFKIVTLMAIAISGIFFFFQVLRFGEHSTRSAADVWEHLRKWPWGSLPGFSLWFDDPSSAQTDTVPGFYTFMGIYDLFGIATRQVGGYADYLALGESSSEFANIYTAFRGLWHDFGAIGSAAFMFAFGYVAARAAMSNQEFLGLALPLYVSIMSFVAFSFVVSILAFTANLVGIFSFVYISKFFFSNNPQPTEREGIVRHAGD